MRSRIDGWSPEPVAYGDDLGFSCATRLVAPADGEVVFDGLATLATVLVDGEVAAESESMWVPVRVPVAAGEHHVEVRCHALTPRLAEPRRPRARWRQKVAYDGNLRWFRTSLLGRAPGFAPGPPVVGLWRPAWFVADEPVLTLRPRLEGDDGVLRARADRDGVLRLGTHALDLRANEWGELRLPAVERWWPHTHGEPHLYEVEFEGLERRIGFRSLAAEGDLLADGLALTVNGIRVFVRGAIWTPVPEGEERATLDAARSAGLNAVRLAGTGVYETSAFHDLADELGMLVWQDLMFANLDYPFEEPAFRTAVDAELDALAAVIGGRPSLAVVCGGSEIEQQVAMLGLTPALGRPPAFPQMEALDAVYVPNAPCGTDRPLRPDDGVANWFGVGGYRRPLSDARAAGVRFASECLALANVGDDGDLTGAMRDAGSPWDFMDVTRHYREELYGAGAPDALLPWVSGDVMAEVLGEWRRAGSPCQGAFVLWLRDLAPGAGWGLLDHRGEPKAALGALRSVLAPVAIWTTDEGLGGIGIHVANDRPARLEAVVRVAAYRDSEHLGAESRTDVTVPGHGSWTGDVETLLGHWIDAAYAYRFGAPQHDLVVVALETPAGALLGQAGRFPAGRPATARSAGELGLHAELEEGVVRLRSLRAVVGVRVRAAGARACEDVVLLEPGRERVIRCAPGPPTSATVSALNLSPPLLVSA